MMSIPSEMIPAKITPIYSGDEYFVHFLEQIQQARKSILIESYIFNLDPIGLKILNALDIARRRGVEVRILVDGIGSYNWIHRLHQECDKRSIAFRIYHPPPFGSHFFTQLSWKNLHRWLGFFRRMNKRNHRKIAIFDEARLLMGSFNVSQVHSENYMGKNVWRDTGLLFEDFASPVDLQFLVSASNEAWLTSRYFRRSNFRAFLRRGRTNSMMRSRFRLNSRTYWRFRLLRHLNQKIKAAERRIWITNAYFLPRKSILRNLRRAARRGVQVQLLLPEITDVWFVREASRSLYSRLLKSGVQIFEFRNRVLHAKTLLIDDWATVGSHNLNHRSFNHDLELEAVVTETPILESLQNQWTKDLADSRKITLAEIVHQTFPRKILSRVLYWFRFWI